MMRRPIGTSGIGQVAEELIVGRRVVALALRLRPRHVGAAHLDRDVDVAGGTELPCHRIVGDGEDLDERQPVAAQDARIDHANQLARVVPGALVGGVIPLIRRRVLVLEPRRLHRIELCVHYEGTLITGDRVSLERGAEGNLHRETHHGHGRRPRREGVTVARDLEIGVDPCRRAAILRKGTRHMDLEVEPGRRIGEHRHLRLHGG
jgi:hypothetical protein